MSCLAVNAVLDLFAEELLTPSRKAAVEAHLTRCESCRAEVARLRAPKAAPSAAPASLKDRLKKAAAAPAATTVLPTPWRSDGRGLALAFGVFAASLFALHLITPAIASERPVSRAAEPWRLP